jgi:hypothetical protein
LEAAREFAASAIARANNTTQLRAGRNTKRDGGSMQPCATVSEFLLTVISSPLPAMYDAGRGQDVIRVTYDT